MNLENSGLSEPSAARWTVLIVDDTESSLAAMELALLGIPGVQVVLARNPLEAVRMFRDNQNAISAVVTDIRMPAMDGFELIQFIRGELRRARLPIIVVTADTDPDTPHRCSTLGANAFFAKPFSPTAVRRTLEVLLDANSNT